MNIHRQGLNLGFIRCGLLTLKLISSGNRSPCKNISFYGNFTSRMVSLYELRRYWVLWRTQISECKFSSLTCKPLQVSNYCRFDLELNSRLEYLTLAVANAKSHPLSADARHETAIQFLTDLEEKVEVAQVQLEIYNTLLPHVDDAPEVGQKVRALSKQLMTMNDVSSSSIECAVFITLTNDV